MVQESSRVEAREPGLLSHILQMSMAAQREMAPRAKAGWARPRASPSLFQHTPYPGLSAWRGLEPLLQAALSLGPWELGDSGQTWPGRANGKNWPELSHQEKDFLVSHPGGGWAQLVPFPRGRPMWVMHRVPRPTSCSASEHSPGRGPCRCWDDSWKALGSGLPAPLGGAIPGSV